MRIRTSFFTLSLCFILLSCTAINKSDLAEIVTGNWLIVYPEHRLKTKSEAAVYGRHQDSIVRLYGLKLISLKEDGTFFETDSLQKAPARWTLGNDSILRVQEGGVGFNSFTATFKSFTNDALQVIQYLPLDGERIKVVWHLKKIAAGTAAATLFEPDGNSWREKPTVPESTAAIRKRLAAILNYYGDYFTLVSKEAAYFSPARVPLPFTYYQHGMGFTSLMPAAFQSFFYDTADAKKACTLLQQKMDGAETGFPTGENFVMEYGLFLKRLAERLGR